MKTAAWTVVVTLFGVLGAPVQAAPPVSSAHGSRPALVRQLDGLSVRASEPLKVWKDHSLRSDATTGSLLRIRRFVRAQKWSSGERGPVVARIDGTRLVVTDKGDLKQSGTGKNDFRHYDLTAEGVAGHDAQSVKKAIFATEKSLLVDGAIPTHASPLAK